MYGSEQNDISRILLAGDEKNSTGLYDLCQRVPAQQESEMNKIIRVPQIQPRNWVAKNDHNRAARHRVAVKYQRRPKHVLNERNYL
jgi:hypothetical protein